MSSPVQRTLSRAVAACADIKRRRRRLASSGEAAPPEQPAADVADGVGGP